jgi:hypothetical protein
MQDWIAGVMLVLGALLVLGGGFAALSGALADNRRPIDPAATAAAKPPWWANIVDSVARLRTTADRLIAWGVVLLVIAAIAGGAIGFQLGASASS